MWWAGPGMNEESTVPKVSIQVKLLPETLESLQRLSANMQRVTKMMTPVHIRLGEPSIVQMIRKEFGVECERNYLAMVEEVRTMYNYKNRLRTGLEGANKVLGSIKSDKLIRKKPKLYEKFKEAKDRLVCAISNTEYVKTE